MAPEVPCPVEPVFHRTRALRGKVLVQRTTERHVDELDSAADAQDRKRTLAGNREECQLEEVALTAGWTQERRRLGAVPGRIDVLTPGEQQTVCSIERPGRHGG